MKELPNLSSIREITREAGALLLRKFETDIEVGTKGKEEVVTEADRECEAFLYGALTGLLPGSGFYGEETGYHPGESGWTWVVDPLDGTHNYSLGVPLWGCMVALMDPNRVPHLGVIDYPALKKMLWGQRGEGAFLDGERVRIPTDPLIGTSPVGIQSKIRIDPFPDYLNKLFYRYTARSFGAIAYHTLLIAKGAMRGCVDLKVKLHDIAAPTVLLEEAGASVTDIEGGPLFPLKSEYPDLVDVPIPFFVGDPVNGPGLRTFLFPEGTPEGIFDPAAYQSG
jgi:fructose-1,6-bisphosphatase/inositol monophosphatase family enzyme